jgi:large subunit ribosomal protein L4
LAQPKTKDMMNILGKLNVSNKALVVTAERNENAYKSARNISGVKQLRVEGLNVYDLLHHDKLVITKAAVTKVEEVLA